MPKLAAALNWPSVAGACLLCCTGQPETVRHLLQCPALQHIRDRYRAELGARLQVAGDPGKEILRVFDTGGEDSQARLTLGGTLDFDGQHALNTEHMDHCAIARWALDKTSKNYIAICWKYRSSVLGELSIENGMLNRVPPKPFTLPERQKTSMPVTLLRAHCPLY